MNVTPSSSPGARGTTAACRRRCRPRARGPTRRGGARARGPRRRPGGGRPTTPFLFFGGRPPPGGFLPPPPHNHPGPSGGPTARAMMLVDRSDEKKWCHRASMRSTSCSGKTTVPSGSTSNSGACANRASSGQLEAVRDPCITRVQWGGKPRPWWPTAGSCRRRQCASDERTSNNLN